MFDNVVRLIGFVGSDAELKTTKAQHEYAVLSLATNGVLEGQERRRLHPAHRVAKACGVGESFHFCCDPEKGCACVRGRRAPLPRVPKKQKKSKNGDQKIRVAEIHLSKIAKLDRAEKRDSETPVPELGPET